MFTIAPKNFIDELRCRKISVIDVRGRDEFSISFIPGSKNIPLDEIERGLSVELPKEEKIYLLCQTGRRSLKACDILRSQGYLSVVSVIGGLSECAKEDNVVIKKSNNISIMRQVQIIAGALVLLGVLLSELLHPSFIGLSGFIGLGLIFAGVSGFCGMGLLLEKLPWNKNITCKLETENNEASHQQR